MIPSLLLPVRPVRACLVFSAALCVAGRCSAAARELSEADFAHVTGDWFIVFHAPYSSYCKKFLATWDMLASDLEREITVAKVDVEKNGALAERFGVRGFPTVLLLHQGMVYEYHGDRSLGNLMAFARGGYADGGVPAHPLPPLPDSVTQAALHSHQPGVRTKLLVVAAAGAISVAMGVVLANLLHSKRALTGDPSGGASSQRRPKDA